MFWLNNWIMTWLDLMSFDWVQQILNQPNVTTRLLVDLRTLKFQFIGFQIFQVNS